MNEEEQKKIKEANILFDFESFQKIFDEMMDDMFKDNALPVAKKPLVMGFNIRISQNGRPVIQQCGNIKAQGGKPTIRNVREPLVDVIETGKDITITAELPGVDKRDIGFSLPSGDCAVINVKGERPFFKEMALPAEVKEKSANAKFKNGILEVRIEKKAKDSEGKGTVKID